MIKKAQIKFICTIMSILLGVFSVIFCATYYITYTFNIKTIEQTLENTASSYFLSNNEGVIRSKSIIAVIHTHNNSNGSYFYELSYDEDTFTKEQAEKIINTAIDNVYYLGRIGNVYYKTFNNDKATKLLVATDATESQIMFRTNTLRTLLIMLITLAILLFIVTAISKSVFKPIRDAFHKQKQFVSNASHELKTPLSIISANADVLQAESDNKWVSNIKSQTERMTGLVEDMLSLAKIDEDEIKLTYEKFNLSEEITDVCLTFDAVAFEKKKNLSLFIRPDLSYYGDKQSVKNVLNILLDNAVKHASDGGDIIVELKKENGKIILSVFNTGSYILAENSNKVFERFYRGDQSRSRESGGSGLGLSIAKSIADANKWKIFAVSVPNESMTITVIF